jgi:lysophospholipase L1-like esterase
MLGMSPATKLRSGKSLRGPRGALARSSKRLGVLLVALIVTLLAVEAAARVRHRVRYGSFRRIHLFERDEDSGLRIPARNRSTARINTDSRGLRSPELEVPKPDGRVRIAFLGGSSTFCAEVSRDEATWPHLVWQRLSEAHPELALDYANAGVGGYSVAGSILNLRHRVAELSPDVIVVYHATNDMAMDAGRLARIQGLAVPDFTRESFLQRWSLAWYLLEKNLVIKNRQAQGTVDSPGRLVFEPEELAGDFRERLAQLVRACQEVSPTVAVATFSHRVRREQDSAARKEACSSALYYMPYMSPDGILATFEAYNASIRAVAAETGALLLDGEYEVPGDDEHFVDTVHLTDRGCEVMAERIVRRLLDAVVLGDPASQ